MAEPFSEMKDFFFGYDTDIYFENGDIKTTTGIDYLEREIYKVLITTPGDWKASPQIGSSLESFIGQQNTREIGNAIRRHIEKSLVDTIYPAQMKVKVIPSSEESLVVLIEIYIDGEVATRYPFEFNFVSGVKKITLMDAQVQSKKSSNEYEINDIAQKSQTNKYYERQRLQR